MKEPGKNVELKNRLDLYFSTIKFRFKTLFCFSFVLMTKQSLKHDFGFPVSLILTSRQYRRNV